MNDWTVNFLRRVFFAISLTVFIMFVLVFFRNEFPVWNLNEDQFGLLVLFSAMTNIAIFTQIQFAEPYMRIEEWLTYYILSCLYSSMLVFVFLDGILTELIDFRAIWVLLSMVVGSYGFYSLNNHSDSLNLNLFHLRVTLSFLLIALSVNLLFSFIPFVIAFLLACFVLTFVIVAVKKLDSLSSAFFFTWSSISITVIYFMKILPTYELHEGVFGETQLYTFAIMFGLIIAPFNAIKFLVKQ